MIICFEDEELRDYVSAEVRSMVAPRFELGCVRKCLYGFYNEIM